MFEYLALLLILFINSFLLSFSETCVVASNEIRIRTIFGERESKIYKILREKDKVITSILVANNIVNILIASLATYVGMKFFNEKVTSLLVLAITILIIYLCEIIPKNVAIRNPESFLMKIYQYVYIVYIIFVPIVNLLVYTIKPLIKRIKEREPIVSEDEIKKLIEIGEKLGVIEKSEEELIKSVFKFGDKFVKDIMIPITDVVAIEANKTIRDAYELMLKTNYSRLPVYEGDIDNVLGIVYIKDVLKVKDRNRKVKEIVRNTIFVPENKKIAHLLKEMQENKIHMAIVVDEYGQVTGIVTLEDIIEEIVGEIEDELEKREERIKKISDREYSVYANIDIDEFSEITGIKIPKGEYDTLAGYLLFLFGRIPNSNERIEDKNAIYIIEKTFRKRILRVRVIKKSPVKE